MTKTLITASLIFGLLGTIVFVYSVFTCDFVVALPSMLFASFWIILACKSETQN
jgi:hypothetical protein